MVAVMMDFFAENSIQLVTHPPYSPDLAPCGFFLFPTVKEKIRGTKFDSPGEAVEAFREEIFNTSDEKWLTALICGLIT